MSARPPLLPLAALAALVFAAPAFAQSAPADLAENGRYAMQQTPDGFLRLDTRTGKVSLCTVKDGAARCTLAADERDAYEREIAALKDGKDAKPATGSGPRFPTDDEIDRTLGVMQKLWRGMNRIIRDDPPGNGPL